MSEDAEFIERAKQNSEDFNLLYQKYADRIYNFFFYRVGHKHDIAEDLRQETFMKALQHLNTYQMVGTSYLTYLLIVAHNLLINFYRQASAHVSVPLEDVGEDEDPVSEEESAMQTKLQADIAWKALEQLPLLERSVMVMRYEQQLSMKEIATAVGKTENAVKLIIMRAKKKLQETLHADGLLPEEHIIANEGA